jgi:hypothetical protein
MRHEHWHLRSRLARQLVGLALWSLVLFFFVGRPARAAELDLPGQLPKLEIHGFVSQGALLSSANNYLADTSRGSFEFSEAGLNFTLPAADRLSLGVQLFSGKLGPLGDYRAVLDWYYLDYHWEDWLGIRAGRVKLPFGLYNDSSDIDSARTAILLPQSIYPAQNRDFLLAQTGFEVYGYASLGSAGALDYRAYAGTIFLELKQQPSSPIVVDTLKVPYVAGGRVLWTSPLDGLRLGGSLQFLRLDTTLIAPPSPDRTDLRIPATLWVASAEYVLNDLLFAVEYSRWLVKTESNRPSTIPSSSTTSERAYALATYRVNSWLQTGAYYSLLFPNVDKRSRREDVQHDAALTLRFDLTANWLVKVEGHYLHGTGALSPSMNADQPLSSLKPDWGLFAVKTTAFF